MILFLSPALFTGGNFNGEYGLHDVVVGVPIKVGKNGMEDIFQITLDEHENAELVKSANDVKATMEKLASIDY